MLRGPIAHITLAASVAAIISLLAEDALARGGRGGGGGGRGGGGGVSAGSRGGGGGFSGASRGGGIRSSGASSISSRGGSSSFSRPSGGGGSFASSRPSGGYGGQAGGGQRGGQYANSRPGAGAGQRANVGDRTNTAANVGNRGDVNRGNRGNINTGDFNRNVNINNDIDGGWGGWYDHPVGAGIATGMVVGATAAMTSAAFGSYYYSLPPGCAPYYTSYYHCGGAYYQPQYEGDTVVYVTVPDPAAASGTQVNVQPH
jgi:hypothetical protein